MEEEEEKGWCCNTRDEDKISWSGLCGQICHHWVVTISLSLSLPSPPPASCWSPHCASALFCVINVPNWRYFLNPSESNSCALSDVICVWTVPGVPRVTFISGGKNSWWVNILNLKPHPSWQDLSGTEKLYHPAPSSHLTTRTRSPSRK